MHCNGRMSLENHITGSQNLLFHFPRAERDRLPSLSYRLIPVSEFLNGSSPPCIWNKMLSQLDRWEIKLNKLSLDTVVI